MSDWKKVKLGEISLNIQTGPFGSQLHQSDYEDTGVPVIMPKDIINGKICDDTIARISSDLSCKLLKYHVEFEDIIYPRRGDISKCAIVDKSQIGWLCGTGCLKISIDKSLAKSKFIYYELQLPKQIGWIINHAIGATMLNLNTNILQNVPIDLPSINTQNRIAEILSRYDSLIENYQKQIKLLEESAQRLYKEWFVDLRFPGYENTKIVDGAPEGWEKKCLGDIFTFVRGKSYTSKELSDAGTIMVNLKNVQPFGGYKRGAEKHITGTFKEEQLLQKGDLVMGVTDMTQERRLVGQVALIPNLDQIATFSMDLIKIIPYKIPKIFLYCTMRYGGISDRISPLANGVNVLHLKPEAMMDIEMIVPNLDTINKFSTLINKQIDKLLSLQNQTILLTEARDRLLPKLMNGEFL